MLKQMRDQMERINFKEIQLFDSIIAKMSEKKNAASNKLVARLKDQGPDLIHSKRYIASWTLNGTLGVILSDLQYKDNYFWFKTVPFKP